MNTANVLSRFRSLARYKGASSWQKPLLDPARFVRNQARKYGILPSRAGETRLVETFFLDKFTVVDGEHVSDEIASYGVYEAALTEAFLRLVKPGQTVVDIGMHLGYYTTLFALLVGPEGSVHAFEPTPSTRSIASQNTGRFGNVKVHPYAVWSAKETLTFRDFGLRWMAFNSVSRPKEAGAPEPKLIEVQTITLDHFREELGRPIGLIKIDAESAEGAILRGAAKVLAEDRPIVSMEVGDTEGSSASRDALNILLGAGYGAWEFTGHKFMRHTPKSVYTYDNLLLAPAGTSLEAL